MIAGFRQPLSKQRIHTNSYYLHLPLRFLNGVINNEWDVKKVPHVVFWTEREDKNSTTTLQYMDEGELLILYFYGHEDWVFILAFPIACTFLQFSCLSFTRLALVLASKQGFAEMEWGVRRKYFLLSFEDAVCLKIKDCEAWGWIAMRDGVEELRKAAVRSETMIGLVIWYVLKFKKLTWRASYFLILKG